MNLDPVADPWAVERRCRARALHAEGVPMVLALEDALPAADRTAAALGPVGPVRPVGPAGPPRVVELGGRLADLLRTYRAALRPDAADDDYWALHDLLVVVAEAHGPFPSAAGAGTGAGAVPGPGDEPEWHPAQDPDGALRVPDVFGSHLRALREGRLLHVVNHHVTPAGSEGELERELTAYLEHFDPVLPEHLDTWFATGRWPLARPGFIAAFYDGYREHATVAAPVCERLGLQGWFLPPTGFLDAPVADQVAFCHRHIVDLPDDPHPDGRLALTWDELAGIGARHVLAGHTSTHAVPREARDEDGARRQLLDPRARLAALTRRPPAALAWRLGLPDAASDPAFVAARAAGYRYLISATRIERIGA